MGIILELSQNKKHLRLAKNKLVRLLAELHFLVQATRNDVINGPRHAARVTLSCIHPFGFLA
jgi:hypothetical protein